jgi:hypothetical protein
LPRNLQRLVETAQRDFLSLSSSSSFSNTAGGRVLSKTKSNWWTHSLADFEWASTFDIAVTTSLMVSCSGGVLHPPRRQQLEQLLAAEGGGGAALASDGLFSKKNLI